MNKSIKCIILIQILLTCLIQTTSIFNTHALDYSTNSELSNVNASFLGDNPKSKFGHSVAIVGDVNGDRFEDFLISAHANDNDGGSQAGSTYLFFGGESKLNMDMKLTSADASYIGERDGQLTGFSVAKGGDVNGDGYDDFIISGYSNNGAEGEIYLIFGKPSGWAHNISLSNADASFIASGITHDVRYSIAGAGDVNGDGYADLIIGMPRKNPGWAEVGQTYIIFGKESGWSLRTTIEESDVSFIGERGGDLSGYSVASPGDINGDGFDDILIGAPGHNYGSGRTYLFFGKLSGWEVETSVLNADVIYNGENEETSGDMVAGAGDINGDGYQDILIGAYQNSNSSYGYLPNVGCTYVIFGKSDDWKQSVNLSTVQISFIGEYIDQYTGKTVKGAGDVNGDGYDDILIGAPVAYYRKDPGRTYLFLGDQNNWIKKTPISNGNAIFIGEDSEDHSGLSLAGGGDINGDGFDDIIIGVELNDEAGEDSGQTYLIFPDKNSGPKEIYSIDAYIDENYSIKVDTALIGDKIYVEIIGKDNNSSKKDVALINVTTSISNSLGNYFRLFETSINSGRYRGFFTIKNFTNLEKQWIGAIVGEKVTISSVLNPTNNITFPITGCRVSLKPMDKLMEAYEDRFYEQKFCTYDCTPTSWSFNTNASWIKWTSKNSTISGTPDNTNVGFQWVQIITEDGYGNFDEYNFTLSVFNRPPKIETINILEVDQDQEYFVDYNSDDDGQGNINWYVKTNASWLSLNSTNGILYGKPSNEDVGIYWINISVTDGNRGWDWTNFTLKVNNINDPPLIVTKDIMLIREDSLYYNDYNATDKDIPATYLKWSFETSALWLNFSEENGIIRGIPSNNDVGNYFVNISVRDVQNASDFHNFTLEVINVNDPPEFSSCPITNASVGISYYYDSNATDIDKEDVLQYYIEDAPEGMVIDTPSGLITWYPLQGQEGEYEIIVEVTDNNATVNQTFILTVHPYLVVIINNPSEGEIISNNYKIQGIAKGPGGLIVEVNIDNRGWKAAEGNLSWSYIIHIWNLTNGNHTIKARTIWSNYSSEETQVSFRVSNPKTTSIDNEWIFYGPLILLVIIAIVLLFRGTKQESIESTRRRRRKPD